jgi:hypothetical protein
MAFTQLKDGRWVVRYRKGTIPEESNRAFEYFGGGIAGYQGSEQRDWNIVISTIKIFCR